MKDSIVFAFGRFNPPTTGHEKLIEKVASVAKQKNADFMVFPSHSQNPKKDPLDFKTKVRFMKKMFPKYSKNIISKNNIKNAFQVASLLHEMGYKKAYMIAGSDRVSEFDGILNKYNGKEGRHGFYDFEDGIQIISAGERDENATGVTGMSASKMRAAAVANRYEDEKDPKTGKKIEGFKSGLPSKFEKTDGKKLFNAIRKAMKVESTELGLWLDDSELYNEFFNHGILDDLDDIADSELLDELFDYLEEARIVTQSDAIKVLGNIEMRKTPFPVKFKDGSSMKVTPVQARKIMTVYLRFGDEYKKQLEKLMVTKQGFMRILAKYAPKLDEEVSQKQINDLEKFADRMLAKYDIDVTFTRHFVDRMNDARNKPEIKVAELQKFFKKIQKKKGAQIKSNPDIEAVLKDISTNLNLPVVINYKNGEFEVVHKTIMRKKNFSTTSKEITYESLLRNRKLVNKIKKTGVVKKGSMSKDNKETKKEGFESFADFITERKTQQDPQIKDKEGTQPKKYYAKDADGDKMSKATKEKRAAHFKKQASAPDGDEKSYKPAPGDKDAKTKPSKHTKKYDQMFGEEQLDEKIEGLQKKADKTGMPYSILKKVYDRGMAAWKSGHRPGTTPQQWAMARVNSFVTKSSGTWGGADKDLAAKVKGRKESVEEGKNLAQQAAIAIAKKESGKYDKNGKKKDEDCWPGFKQIGMKDKNGKKVPNCVPESFSGAENAPELPGGAGEWGTDTLRDRYIKDTPFQEKLMTPKERLIAVALEKMHKLVTSKGSKHSVGNYAFDISKSFRGLNLSARELEKLYRERYPTQGK